jgi:hypothetical protein
MRYLFLAFKERTVERLFPGDEKNKKVTAFFVLCVTFLFFSSAGAVASAETLFPWWHLSSSTQTTSIQPGAARDDVQQITVSASTGSYDLKDRGVGIVRSEGTGPLVGLTVGEEPEKLRKAFEELYGTGNIEVTSPCTGVPNPSCTEVNNRWEVYEVKFVGKLTDRYVYAMTHGELGEFPPEYPFVTVKQLVKGRTDGTILVSATNLGDADTVGCKKAAAGAGKYLDSRCNKEATTPGTGEYENTTPIVLSDELPAGLTAVSIEADANATLQQFESGSPPLTCALAALTCTFTGSPPPGLTQGHAEDYSAYVPPYDRILMRIDVNVDGTNGATSGESNAANITGGGAPAATAKAPITVSDAPIPFGVNSYELRPENARGGIDTQAGSHPFQLTTSFEINQAFEGTPVALTKDLHFKLPPGLIGNPTPFAQCSLAVFLGEAHACPADTVVGVSGGSFTGYYAGKLLSITYQVPLYNLEPAFGEPARFGFIVASFASPPVLLTTAVRTGGDYGVTVNVLNIPQIVEFLSSEVTFWGVPGDARHNVSRGTDCLIDGNLEAQGNKIGTNVGSTACPPFQEVAHPAPLLSLPTSCTGELHTTMEADSWLESTVPASTLNTQPMGALDGCDRLPFTPEIKVSPDSQQASRPTGLTVDVHVPQEGQLNGEGLAQSNIKNIVVTLPDGVTLNPSGGDGLLGCSEAQIGFEGSKELQPEFEPGVKTLAFTPKLPGSYGASEALNPGVNFCPNASKIAEATIRTPLLPNPLKGFVYLASPQNFSAMPQENPFETHVAMYLVAEDPVSGSLVKIPGSVELGGQPGVEGLAPGQIRSTFANNPQLPFEDAELHFFGGERAPLASPSHCGKYTTNATFTPWSGEEPANSQSSFEVTSGPNGSPCPGAALPFSASLASGTTNNNAESYTALDRTMSREDGQEPIQSVTLHYPAGISGLLSDVKLCGEAEANAGTCGPESQIGETIVSVGVGGDPFTVTGGKVFITGPYEGAPFGLSITNPAKAGPFDLKEGRPVVVRAKIEVDPSTAALTITTDPSGSPFAIPTIIEGFPLQIQHVNVLVNRPGFTFNPSNCAPTAVTGVIDSSEGASSPVSVPFQATNCAFLKFTPKFTVSTSGKTSKAGGASLTAKVTEPSEPFGSQANISKVKVELPKQLPSRLTTLQKACTAAQFEANPAGCPTPSVIGHAKVTTKLVPVPLEGPIYFVSHGGEAFPSLEIVLQGYGVKIVLVGATFISKAGITSTTFKTVPDQPFETFELTLPEGPYSALAANGSLCGQKLTMPNEFIGQNGAAIHQNTAISVAGCAKAKALTRAQKLAKALKACKKDKNKGKRAKCEKTARKQYGPIKSKKKAKK